MAEAYEIKKLLPLVAEERIELPSTEAKSGGLKWITAITIVTPAPNQEGRIGIEYRPMTDTGEIIYRDANNQDTTRTIVADDLYSLRKKLPKLDTAFAAVLDAISPIETIVRERSPKPQLAPR